MVHADILYGSKTAKFGIKYILFLVDRATRNKYAYPLKSLRTDILPAFKTFCRELGFTPKHFITDFDKKLMGTSIQPYLDEAKSTVTATPAGKQRKNGLCESNWRSLLRMSRGWLTSNFLPTDFWWFAFKRATEVSNYVPLKINNIISTPHELAYKVKPDARNLFPMFAVAYVRRSRDAETDRETFHSQSLCAIAVGRCNKSAQLLFYHPPTKQTISSDDFSLDETLCSGPVFGLKYDGGLYVDKYYDEAETFSPPTHAPSSMVFIKHNHTYIKCKVLTIPDRDSTV